MHKLHLYFLSLIWLNCACQPERLQHASPTVEVRKHGEQFQLYRHGKPFYIKGAAGHTQLEKIAAYGGNSIRTWSTQDAKQILDEAHRYGITVSLGLEVGKEWWGEDFSYWNFRAVDQKIIELKKVIEQYKDHPALLMWSVGNEVQLFGGNHFLVFHTMDRIAKMIHETDPNHPVMTTVPLSQNFNKRGIMSWLCPNIDILGVNTFSKLPRVQEEIRRPLGWNKAYILTEWGSPGPWETKKTEWGAPFEPNSSEKARYMEHFWDFIQKDNSLCLGSYAFYWGNKYERTYTFFSLFSEEGYETEMVNVLQSKWSKNSPDNWAPKIDSMVIHSLPQQKSPYLIAGSTYEATIYSHDPDKDPLTYRWELRHEGYDNVITGGFEYNLDHFLLQDSCATLEFRSPEQEGAYRLISYIYDGQKHVATHNMPVYVKRKL